MPKRTHGEGTIYQDKKGLWRGEITLGYDPGGKRIKKSFSSMDREKLLKKMNDEKFNLHRNIVTVTSDYTVAEWVGFWLENYKAHTLRSKTYDNYENALNRHIRNAIGDYKLTKINTDAIQQMYNRMHKNGLSANSIRIVNNALSQAFDQAVKNKLIYENPCKSTVRPKIEKSRATAMTTDEQELFIQHCKDESTYHKLFIFLLNAGLRVGEARALTWDDIDFVKKEITINKTASLVKNRDENAETKTKIIINSTKTESGERIVPMNSKVESILLAQKEDEVNEIFVFSSKVGTMLMGRNVNRAHIDLLGQAGLSRSITVHTLRHTFATRLLEKGVNPKVVSDLLGHASIQITLNIYSHVMPNIKTDAVNLLD
ncbi:MAG: site-specific integrase [Defluviitaleaceae bacterium]|nr:site-specific integrase [Defluviitaleaceae bacterium]